MYMKSKLHISILFFIISFGYYANAQTYMFPSTYKVFWLHGLNEDNMFFDDMRFYLTPANGTCLQYDAGTTQGIEDIAASLTQVINEDAILVGHSAGGLIARSILKQNNHVKGIITVGTPNNGAGIINSMNDGSYQLLIDNINSHIDKVLIDANNVVRYLSYSILTFLIRDLNELLLRSGIILYLPMLKDVIVTKLSEELDKWNNSLLQQKLVTDMAPNSQYITNINNYKTSVPVYSVYGNESPGQFYRLLGTYLNLDNIKGSRSNNTYDDYLTNSDGLVTKIFSQITYAISMIDFTIRTYDKWYLILAPNIKAAMKELNSVKYDLEKLYKYLAYYINTDWAEVLGAYQIKSVTYRRPIYDNMISIGGDLNPGIGSGNGNMADPPETHSDNMDKGTLIGYTEHTEYFRVNEPHDGIVGRNHVLIDFNGAPKDTASVDGVNHLEMGVHKDMRTLLKQLIKKLQPNNTSYEPRF